MRLKPKGRARPFRTAFIACVIFCGVVGAALIYHPDSMLPHGWNPNEPLAITDDVTPLTGWKLANAAADSLSCKAILSDYAEIRPRPTLASGTSGCGIATPVDLERVGEARMSGVQTDCATALRLAMWEHHTVQPVARRQLGTSVTTIIDIGSYNCRSIRTVSGETGRLSSHATASAIDISGFRFADGRSTLLVNDWDGRDNIALFLRAVRDGACGWFPLTLSPDYNELHKDHFHLQARGWRSCR